MLHKTYGVYLNGSWKRNAVDPNDLPAHIQYNKDFRPGRALIVDGVVLHQGYFSEEAIELFVREQLPKIDAGWTPTQSTAPYQ